MYDRFDEYSKKIEKSKRGGIPSSVRSAGALAVPTGAVPIAIYDAVNNIRSELGTQYSQIAHINTIMVPLRNNVASLSEQLASVRKVKSDIEQLQKKMNRLARSLKVQTKPTRLDTKSKLKKVSRKSLVRRGR